MSELTRDLNQYLTRNVTKKENNEPLLPVTIQDLKLPKFSLWFSKPNNNEDSKSTTSNSSTSWFSSAENDPCLPSLSHKHRILGFLSFITLGIICFSLAAAYTPLLLLKARKFSLLFTLGSLFSILSFSFLWGPVNHMKHMFSSQRIIFTSVYFISLFATLYFALSLQSTILTSIAAVIQVGALLCFILINIPGGQTGIKFMSSICSSLCRKTVSKVLPI